MVKFDVASAYHNTAATHSAVPNLAKLTLLPMLSYIFSFNDSVAWSPEQTLMQPQFLWIPSKPYLSPDGYRCLFFLAQVLTPSTHQVHLFAQCHYINFCPCPSRLSPRGALLPADKLNLMHFAMLLVHLSTVQSLHSY